MPMVDDLLKGLQVERDFFIKYSTGMDESLHILVQQMWWGANAV